MQHQFLLCFSVNNLLYVFGSLAGAAAS